MLVNSRFVHDLVRGDKLSRASVTSVFVEGLSSGLRWFNLAVGIGGHCGPGRRARKAIPDAPPVLTAAAKTLVLKMLETAQPHPASSGGLYEFVDEAVAAGRDGAGERWLEG